MVYQKNKTDMFTELFDLKMFEGKIVFPRNPLIFRDFLEFPYL